MSSSILFYKSVDLSPYLIKRFKTQILIDDLDWTPAAEFLWLSHLISFNFLYIYIFFSVLNYTQPYIYFHVQLQILEPLIWGKIHMHKYWNF